MRAFRSIEPLDEAASATAAAGSKKSRVKPQIDERGVRVELSNDLRDISSRSSQTRLDLVFPVVKPVVCVLANVLFANCLEQWLLSLGTFWRCILRDWFLAYADAGS
jgi:hypothetical protein